MSDTIISVENLSKRYIIGHQSRRREPYTALRDVFASEARNFMRSAADLFHGKQIVQGDEIEEFWALRDVSFEVKEGEALGILGRNGAGKSTLLKILSRITEPTEGRVRLRGRVGSLLEVGTGFHPELTGRENIFLNGTILGMSRKEIARRFDAIVAFAEVERFLDTPVKRYSSGMYVRLAFAVAAYLDSDILIVDEVLAVGDAGFRKKCIGKMDEVSRGGRTVLFVSHNVEAILKLCTCGVVLDSGRIISAGKVAKILSSYLSTQLPSSNLVDLTTMQRAGIYRGTARFERIIALSEQRNWSFLFGERLAFDIWIDAKLPMDSIELGVGLFSTRGFEVASWTNACSQKQLPLQPGRNVFRLEYENLGLLPGQYSLGIGLRSDGGFEDYVPEAVSFEVVVSSASANIDTQSFGGVIVPVVNVFKLEHTCGQQSQISHAND